MWYIDTVEYWVAIQIEGFQRMFDILQTYCMTLGKAYSIMLSLRESKYVSTQSF